MTSGSRSRDGSRWVSTPRSGPSDSLTSNIGHCLWTGIVDDDKARLVAERIMSYEMFSGWGIRTLATSMGGYNPVSYHCGSVWPHDTAIVAAGLARYGFDEAALKIVRALLDAAQALGGRLPELFSGLDRDELSVACAAIRRRVPLRPGRRRLRFCA